MTDDETKRQVAAIIARDIKVPALEAEIAQLREALYRLGIVGQAITETFTTREVLLEYEGSQEIGVTPDYGTIGKKIGQELMAALVQAAAALEIRICNDSGHIRMEDGMTNLHK
jgi:hypothetical protein